MLFPFTAVRRTLTVAPSTSARFLSLSRPVALKQAPTHEKTVTEAVSDAADSAAKSASELFESAKKTIADATVDAENAVNHPSAPKSDLGKTVNNLGRDAEKMAKKAYVEVDTEAKKL